MCTHVCVGTSVVVPFSRGCNLLTVYSKKHIDSEPELKTAKMSHNQRTMKTLGMQVPTDREMETETKGQRDGEGVGEGAEWC